VLVGAVHDLTGSWSTSVGLLVVLLLPQTVAGIGAGRRLVVGDIRRSD
jgi:CP family cyanate transporter-like MFS transporter